MLAETHAEHGVVIGQDHQHHIAVRHGLIGGGSLDGAARNEIIRLDSPFGSRR